MKECIGLIPSFRKLPLTSKTRQSTQDELFPGSPGFDRLSPNGSSCGFFLLRAGVLTDVLIRSEVTPGGRSQTQIPEGAKPFALKSTRQGNNDGEVLYLSTYIGCKLQSEAPDGAIELVEGAVALSAEANTYLGYGPGSHSGQLSIFIKRTSLHSTGYR